MQGFRKTRQRLSLACVTILGAAFAGLGGDARAFEQPIPTTVGLVRFGGSTAVGRGYKLVSRSRNLPLFSLPVESTALTGGALTVTVGEGTLDCTLAAQLYDGTEGWIEFGNPPGSRGYKYMNRAAPGGAAGACRIVIVKERLVKVIARATGNLPVPVDDPPGNPDIGAVLVLGGDSYCARPGTTSQ